MIATVIAVWPSLLRTTVIVADQADGRKKSCFVWMRGTMGPWLASLCLTAESNGRPDGKRQIALTVKPRTDYGYEIEDAELVPITVPRVAGPDAHLGATE